MIREHYTAVRDLIPETTDYARYFGDVPRDPSYPYVVLWGDLGTEGSESLGTGIDQLVLRPRVTMVAEGFEQLLHLARQVRAALNQKVPSVAGWTPSKLTQLPLTAATNDYDVTLTDDAGNSWHPVFAVDEYPFISDKN